MPEPRVLVIGHTYVVGVNQAKLGALARRLPVAALVPDGWRAGEWGRRLPLERAEPAVRLFAGRARMNGRSGAYWYPLRRLAAVHRAWRPAVIHVEQECFSVAALQAAVWARLGRRPLSIFCWENVDRPLSWPRRIARGFVLRTAALAIAGSRDAGALLRRWGYRGRLEILPQLGVDPAIFAPPARPRRRGGAVTVGYVGRLVPEKGVDVLLDALARLRKDGRAVRLEISGAGPAEEALRAEAERLGIADAVAWRGTARHDEVPHRIAGLDVLVLPSRSAPSWREQFGHVLIEAMAMGVPVVGSSCGAIPEVIGRDDAVFAEGDGEGLAERLERLAEDGDWRAELAAYGRARVADRYTHERIADRLAPLLRALAEGRR